LSNLSKDNCVRIPDWFCCQVVVVVVDVAHSFCSTPLPPYSLSLL
jgi:hypothetical protein